MKKVHVVPTSVNKRLISTLMSTRKVDPNENKNFALKSSSEFASRSGDVFGKLQSLEKSHETWISKNDTLECFDDSDEHALPEPFKTPQSKLHSKEPNTPKLDVMPIKPDVVKIPDSEAVFKKPFPAKNLKRKTSAGPNFGKPPKKWTKYSLEDVPISSDATNAAVAFQFLNELSSRKEQKVESDDNTDTFVFKKPKLKERSATSRIKARVALAVEGDSSELCSGEKEVECKSSGSVMLAHLQDE